MEQFIETGERMNYYIENMKILSNLIFISIVVALAKNALILSAKKAAKLLMRIFQKFQGQGWLTTNFPRPIKNTPRKDKVSRNEDRFRCVLCQLEGDTGRDTATVEEAFAKVHGIELIRSTHIVKASGAGDTWRPAMRDGARGVLETWNAEVVVIGQVKRSGKALNLWFVPREGDGTLDRGYQKPYILVEGVLQEDFYDELHAQITSAALTSVEPFANTKERALALKSELMVVVRKLKKLLEGRSITKPTRRIALHNALGNALTALGEHSSEAKYLEQAVVAYHAVLAELICSQDPLYWAVTQNNLGNTLNALSKHNGSTEFLEQAVAAYHAALKQFTRERTPLYWATAQNNLGNALTSLGKRKSGTGYLEQAACAFQEALKERTRERVPLDWATTQNNP